MSGENKIYLFKDREDYVKKITYDKIFNITGEKGSGKSYFSDINDNEEGCNVVHLDSVFIPDGSCKHDLSDEIRDILIKKYGNDLDTNYFETKYYKTIIEYLKKKNKAAIIEGVYISEIHDISNIVGTVIVKRTGILKCLFRTIKRDYANEYFMKKEIEIHGRFAKITRLYKVIKRRKKILKSYHNIEQFINTLENYKV